MAKILTIQPLKKNRKKTSYRSLSYNEFHKRQNNRKGRYTLAHFWENCKTNSNWSHRTQKAQFLKVFRVIYQNDVFPDFIFTFFPFLKHASEYSAPSGNLLFLWNLVLSCSNFLGRTSPRWCSRCSPSYVSTENSLHLHLSIILNSVVYIFYFT